MTFPARPDRAATLVARADAFQRRHRLSAVTVATVHKYVADGSANLAQMIAFGAFFSVFPLLLVFVTTLGWLPEHTKAAVLGSAAELLPVIDPRTVGTLGGSWVAFATGAVTALWSGSGVVRGVQNAFNTIWEVPRAERPRLAEQLVRSGAVLATLGVAFVVSTVVSSIVTGTASAVHLGAAGRAGGLATTLALDVVAFVAAFRMLTDRQIRVRDVLPGAVFAGVAFFVLQHTSTFIVGHRLHSVSATYGTFATVIVLLWWFYLQAQVTLLGAQLNVVLARHAWPVHLPGMTPAAQ